MSDELDSHVNAYQGESIYDFDNELMLKWYSQRILQLCQDASSVLELGLGHGHTTNTFSQSIPRHVVLEGSSAVIDNFKQNYPDCQSQIIETFFETYHGDESFDVIVLGFVLEHVEDPCLILRKFKNCLATDGRMFVSVPNAESLNRRLGHLAGLLPDLTTLSENDLLLGHRRFYTSITFAEELDRAGYEVVRMEGIYLKPFTSLQMQSLNLGSTIYSALCDVGMNYPELSCGLLAQVRAKA